LRALAEYRIDPERGLPSLDGIVAMAARLFDCPAAAVNMVGDAQVFLASSIGIGDFDHARDISFCAHAMLQDDIMVIEDAALDPRFHDNPLVTGGVIRFYAGIALRAPSGHALGALCVIDPHPHPGFSAQERGHLQSLARLVADKMELRRLEVALPTHAHASPVAIVTCDADGGALSCNPAAATLFGWPPETLATIPLDRLVAPADRPLVRSLLHRAHDGTVPLLDGTPVQALRHDGTAFPAELHWSHWHEGEALRFGVIVHDLGASPPAAETLDLLARHDSLTGLPNRDSLIEHLAGRLGSDQPTGLIVVDLAGFAEANNTLGHAAGDDVLRQVATRLAETCRPETSQPVTSLPDTFVARLGGDAFAAVLPHGDPLALGGIARAIVAALAAPLLASGHEIALGSHCGIAIAPDHATRAEDLLDNAELALMQARATGRGETALFLPQMRAEAVARRLFEAELHHALRLGQFTLFYQPQFALDSGALTGAEALIRWNHLQRGLLEPAAFLPALEASSLAEATGCWVLDAACRQAAIWRRAHPDFTVSVNLSASQLRRGNLCAVVAGTLASHGLPPQALELELTENIALAQHDHVLAQLHDLRALGVRLSFDDFGTGFASLNLLRHFPVHAIKIDRGFVQDMQGSDRDRAIVTGLIRMARDLSLEVIAEGVESATAAQFLRRHGCAKAQGYYFGEPRAPGPFVERHLALAAPLRTRA
jgi:diguanylate cyclase (GGDEF)-like protein/PAS domain S-box-containing protein